MDDRRLNEIRERAQSVYRLTEWEGIAAIDKVELVQLQKDVPDLLDHIEALTLRQEQDAATIWALMDALPGREEMSEAQWAAWRGALYSEAVEEIQAVYAERDGLRKEVERLRALVKESLTTEPSGELPPGYTLQGPVHNDWWWVCDAVEGDRYEYLEPVFESAWRHYRANGGGR
jgi:hypothetical protein